MLERCGFDPEPFVEERVLPLVREHMWQTPLARTHARLEDVLASGLSAENVAVARARG